MLTLIKIIGNISVFISGFMTFLVGIGLIYYAISHRYDKDLYPGGIVFGSVFVLSYGFVIMYISILLSMIGG